MKRKEIKYTFEKYKGYYIEILPYEEEDGNKVMAITLLDKWGMEIKSWKEPFQDKKDSKIINKCKSFIDVFDVQRQKSINKCISVIENNISYLMEKTFFYKQELYCITKDGCKKNHLNCGFIKDSHEQWGCFDNQFTPIIWEDIAYELLYSIAKYALGESVLYKS